MILVLNVSHVDLLQAVRLMGWIGFLSDQNNQFMLNEKLLLVVSRRASCYPKFKHLCWLSARIFGQARCYVPETEHESGWPGAANWMFQKALEHVERHFQDDIFFLEPDGIPTCPDWYTAIQNEWGEAQRQGKTFMGAHVHHDVPHMTGIAVYGRNWRRVAPTLIDVPDHDAWDTHAGKETLRNARITPLIQHVFKRHDPGWQVPALGIVNKATVVFHQDKKGRLIYMLDQAYWGGECRGHPLFGYAVTQNEEKVMRKYYYAANVTRAVKAHGKRFLFDALDCFGGSVPGAYTTELESEQAALADLTSDVTSGVSEIGQEEWEKLTKKKAPAVPVSNTSKSLSPSSSSPLPQAALLATPSQSPAVLVAEPSEPASETRSPGEPVKDIAEVIKVDTVEPAQLPNIGTKLPRPEKKVKPLKPKEA